MNNKNLVSKFLEKAYLIRFTEEEISKRYSEQKMRCPVHLSIGQEIPSAALNLILKKNDYAISYHRAHAHYLAKGCSLKKMIAEIYGKSTGCSGGVGGSMHLVDKEKTLTNKLKNLEHKISLVKNNDLDYLDMLYREKFKYGTEDEIIIKLK